MTKQALPPLIKQADKAALMASIKPSASMYTPNLTYTYPGRLDTDLIEPIRINTPAFSDLFRIIQGVRCGDYLHYVQPLTSVLSKPVGDCNPVYTQAGSITDKQLITGPFAVNLEWCPDEFIAQCNIIVEKYSGMGLDLYDIQSNLQSLIFKQVMEAMNYDLWKVMFFGDNSLGSGSSNIYSTIDGVLTKFFDSQASYCVQPVDNTMGDAHNSTLAADKARDILRLLWGNSNIRLKSLPDNQKAFWVTGSFWENYYDSLINNCCVEGSWRLAQDGATKLYYRGIELIPLWFADDTLGAATNVDSNPFYDEVRHFAIYTAKNNHVMGVERTSDLDNLTACFDCRTNATLIKGRFRAGYNFLQCDLISWAK
jgi:hypothetical protein